MGYFWLYSIREFNGAYWLRTFIKDGTVLCDVKMMQLLNYFDVPSEAYLGYRYLVDRAPHIDILLTYRDMFTHGYVIHGGYSLGLPADCTSKLDRLNALYSNGAVDIYAGA